MLVSDISKKPISILKKSSISEIIKKLLEYNISRLIVVDGGKPIGIVTEKDVGLFLFSETTHQGLDNIPITKNLKNSTSRNLNLTQNILNYLIHP